MITLKTFFKTLFLWLYLPPRFRAPSINVLRGLKIKVGPYGTYKSIHVVLSIAPPAAWLLYIRKIEYRDTLPIGTNLTTHHFALASAAIAVLYVTIAIILVFARRDICEQCKQPR